MLSPVKNFVQSLLWSWYIRSAGCLSKWWRELVSCWTSCCWNQISWGFWAEVGKEQRLSAGVTTVHDYLKHTWKDSTLQRCLQPVVESELMMRPLVYWKGWETNMKCLMALNTNMRFSKRTVCCCSRWSWVLACIRSGHVGQTEADVRSWWCAMF